MRRLWIPSYVCREVALAPQPGCALVVYDLTPVGELRGLEPQLGDAVLGVDWFGRPAPAPLLDMARERRDVLWIEDRAQALDPGAPAWGDVLLYSPRKLVGVADGGLVVSDRPLPSSPPPVGSDPRAWAPFVARFGDPHGAAPERWHPAFRAREASVGPEPSPMDPLTRALLGRIAAAPLAERRRANDARLLQALPEFALWPQTPSTFAPLAFPVRVRDAAETVRALAAQGVFAPRHWADLPCSPAAFPEAHRLAASLVSLPCDHRYGPEDMDRVAAALRVCAEPWVQPR